jgi:cell division septal protein FtsQ
MRQRRRRLFFIRFYIILFFLLVIVFGLAILSGHERVRIQTILVTGNASVMSDDVLAIANQDMAGRYWYLFARNNSLIFPRWKIKADLLREIKNLKAVDISWQDWQTISIQVSERRPHSTWCGETVEAPAGECYFLDKSGYIYDSAPVFSGSLFIKNYGPLTGEAPVGQSFLPAGVYSALYALIDILAEKGLRVTALSYDGSAYQFYLDRGPVIIFTDHNGPSVLAGFESAFVNLLTALETKNLNLDKDGDNIKYIDLRFDNKIVIGKKDEQK